MNVSFYECVKCDVTTMDMVKCSCFRNVAEYRERGMETFIVSKRIFLFARRRFLFRKDSKGFVFWPFFLRKVKRVVPHYFL